MKKILLTVLILATGMILAGADIPSGWVTGTRQAVKRAETEKKPLLVLISDCDWQGTGKNLYNQVLNNDDFQRIAPKYAVCLLVKVSKKPTAKESANSASHLIHKTAGLAEEHVLCVLRILCDLLIVDRAVIIEVIHNIADHNLECRRGGDSATLQHLGGGVSVIAAYAMAVIHKRVDHAANERARSVALEISRALGVLHGHHVLGVALGVESNNAVVVLRCDCNNVAVDRTCEHATVVVVGVIAHYLASAGNREYRYISLVAVHLGEAIDGLEHSLGLILNVCVELGVFLKRALGKKFF